jgi:hypothetical protein
MAPMKNINRTILAILLACTNLMLIGCSNKPPDQLDQKWTPPVAVSASENGVCDWFYLHKCQDTIIGIRPLRGGSGQCLFLNRTNNSWSELSLTGDYTWGYAAIDRKNKQMLVPMGYAENEQLVMNALIGTISESVGLRDITEKKWITDKKTLFGETGSNVRLNETGRREGIGLGLGILNGSEVDIPYSLHATTILPPNIYSRGPFNNGVFHSGDSGKNWQVEQIFDFNAGAPDICRTKNYYYCFVIRDPIPRYGIWFSRKAIHGDAWDAPKSITKTFANADGRYVSAVEGDTVNVCWMDRRHNKWRFNFGAPPVENNEIFYRQRKDADKDWDKEVLLSKGLLYSYAPTISAEGDKVVVAWAGIQTAGKWHTLNDPNDIYYVTSKDGGKMWTNPLKVTDGAKDGITAGYPQVVLLNNVIHLLYTQGKGEKPQELSPGLTKLGQGPWPIYYTQRPFPD